MYKKKQEKGLNNTKFKKCIGGLACSQTPYFLF